MSYVICQARPPGKSALADEATAVAIVNAIARGNVVEGPYLEWSDPDANNGLGDERWTNNPAKAKRFKSFAEASQCWQAQSTVRPTRDDGKPNRPMTAYSVTIREIA